MKLVIDASVALKLIFDEGDSKLAVDVFAAANSLAPELLKIETGNRIARAVFSGEFSLSEGVLAQRTIENSIVRFYPDRNLLERAFLLSSTLNHAIYDCIYLALAEQENACLVTADGRFCRLLKEANFTSVKWLSIPECLDWITATP